MTPIEKLTLIRGELNALLYERTEEVDGLVACLLARVNLFIVGPPGTGKSKLVVELCKRLNMGVFARLLTKFTVPEEVFGPVSVQGMKQDQYRRITTKKLPEAEVAFLDEIWKASSAILNSMLRVLNEREYENDGQTMKCPLQFGIGASNEFPKGEELSALYDRFPMRFVVNYLADPANWRKMMFEADKRAAVPVTLLDAAELVALQAQAKAVPIPDKTAEVIEAVYLELKKQGIVLSDRRWEQARELCRAQALLNGHSEVKLGDIEVLKNIAWNDASHKDAVAALVLGKTNPFKAAALALRDEMVSVVGPAKDTQDAGVVTEVRKKLKALYGKAQEVIKAAAAEGADIEALEAVAAEMQAANKELVNKFASLDDK